MWVSTSISPSPCKLFCGFGLLSVHLAFYVPVIPGMSVGVINHVATLQHTLARRVGPLYVVCGVSYAADWFRILRIPVPELCECISSFDW